jgi:hypothetical protein
MHDPLDPCTVACCPRCGVERHDDPTIWVSSSTTSSTPCTSRSMPMPAFNRAVAPRGSRRLQAGNMPSSASLSLGTCSRALARMNTARPRQTTILQNLSPLAHTEAVQGWDGSEKSVVTRHTFTYGNTKKIKNCTFSIQKTQNQLSNSHVIQYGISVASYPTSTWQDYAKRAQTHIMTYSPAQFILRKPGIVSTWITIEHKNQDIIPINWMVIIKTKNKYLLYLHASWSIKSSQADWPEVEIHVINHSAANCTDTGQKHGNIACISQIDKSCHARNQLREVERNQSMVAQPIGQRKNI